MKPKIKVYKTSFGWMVDDPTPGQGKFAWDTFEEARMDVFGILKRLEWKDLIDGI